MSSTHGPARTGADPLRPLAVRALRVWISAALVPADVILLPALFPDTESPDGEQGEADQRQFWPGSVWRT